MASSDANDWNGDSVRQRVAALEQHLKYLFARQARKRGGSSNGVDSYCYLTDPLEALASSCDSAEILDDTSGDNLNKEEVPTPTEDESPERDEHGSLVCIETPVPPLPDTAPRSTRLQAKPKHWPKAHAKPLGRIPENWDEVLAEEEERQLKPPPQRKASALSAQPPTERTEQAEQPPAPAGFPRLRLPSSQQHPPIASSQQQPRAQRQPVVIPMTESGAEDLEDIQLGGCAFADEGGYEPDHLQAPPEAAYGGDGSAQRLQAIVSTAAKKARMVMMGGNDAEILSIAARVADTGPSAPRSPPGPPPQKLRQWQQWQPQAQPCTPPGPPPQSRLDEQEPCHWSPVTPADPDDVWAAWHPTHTRGIDTEDSDDESVMAHTDVGDYRHAHEPAPTFVSMAAPLNAKGQLTGPGGQILHIDSSGHVLNEKNERCDLHGRLTRPRGARSKASGEKYQMKYWNCTKRPGLVTKAWQWGDDWRADDWNNNAWENWGWNQRWIATPVPPPPPVDDPEGQPQAQREGQPQALGAGSSSSTDCWASQGWTVDEWSAYFAHTKK